MLSRVQSWRFPMLLVIPECALQPCQNPTSQNWWERTTTWSLKQIRSDILRWTLPSLHSWNALPIWRPARRQSTKSWCRWMVCRVDYYLCSKPTLLSGCKYSHMRAPSCDENYLEPQVKSIDGPSLQRSEGVSSIKQSFTIFLQMNFISQTKSSAPTQCQVKNRIMQGSFFILDSCFTFWDGWNILKTRWTSLSYHFR